MFIEDLMIHGGLPRSGRVRKRLRFGSALAAQRLRAPPRPPPNDYQGWGEWDEGNRLCAQAVESDRAGRRRLFRIEEDTPIVPLGAAERVCDEASLWLREPFPPHWTNELAERAHVIYQHSRHFRQLLQKSGDTGLRWPIAFMRHWLYALLDSRRPALCQRLPRSFASGRNLPPPD